MDWMRHGTTWKALGCNGLTYTVGNNGIEGAPVYAEFELDGVSTAVYHGPEGTEERAKAWAEHHSINHPRHTIG